MPISTDQALAGIEKFIEDYPGAENLQFYVVNKFEDLYGREKAQHIPEKAKGAYHPARGFVALACANIHNDGDLRETLQHEVIGHYGTLTFERGQKKALMTAIRGSRQSPDMADDWAYIDRVYSNAPESIKCEEMFCLQAERIVGKPLHDLKGVNRTFGEVVMGGRTMNQADLQALVNGVADGLARGTREQQIFPQRDSDQYRLQDALEPARDEAKELLGPAAKAHPAQPAEGSYKGPIVGHTTTHVLQQVSATQTVAHDKAAFAQAPGIDGSKPVQVKYEQGKAQVHPPRAPAREKETGRGR